MLGRWCSSKILDGYSFPDCAADFSMCLRRGGDGKARIRQRIWSYDLPGTQQLSFKWMFPAKVWNYPFKTGSLEFQVLLHFERKYGDLLYS